MRVQREVWGQPSLTLFSGITSLFHTCSTLTEHLLYAWHCPGHWGHQNEEHQPWPTGDTDHAYVWTHLHWLLQHMIVLSTSIGHPGGRAMGRCADAAWLRRSNLKWLPGGGGL